MGSRDVKELYIKIKADAKDIVKDFDKSVSTMEKAAEKINMGKDFRQELDDIKKDIDEIRDVAINPNVDYTQVEGLDKILERVSKRIDYVNSKINTHVKSTDSSKIQRDMEKLGGTLDTISGKTKGLTELVQSLFHIKDANDNPFISDKTLENIKKTRLEIEKLKKTRDKLDAKPSVPKDMGDIEKYYVERTKRLNEIQEYVKNTTNLQKRNKLTAKQSNDLKRAILDRGLIAKELNDLQSELSIKNSQFNAQFKADDLNKYVKEARAQIGNSLVRAQNKLSTLDPLNLADVTTFELKDGVIKVPVQLDAEHLRGEVTDLVENLKQLIEPVIIPLEFETKNRKINFKETKQYQDLVSQIDSIDVEGFDKGKAKKKLDELAAKYSKALSVSLKFEKTDAKKSINNILTEIKGMIDEAKIGQSLYEGIEKSLELLKSEMEVVFGNNIIDNWAKNFISTIDLVCDRIDRSFKSISSNNIYDVLKGWYTSDQIIRTHRDPSASSHPQAYPEERSAYGENERFVFANYKTGKTSNPYYYGGKETVPEKLISRVKEEIEATTGKKLGEQFDTTIHSHPITPKILDKKRYEPTGYATSFSVEDLNYLKSAWEDGIRRIVVESNGMLNTLDLSMYGNKDGKKLLEKIIRDYSKVVPYNVMDSTYIDEYGNGVIDYSRASNYRNEQLKNIINKHSRSKSKDQILTQQTVDSLRIDANQFSAESQEISSLTQTILRMAEAIEQISSQGITSHVTEDFFNKLHAEVDAVVQSVNNLAEAFQNVAASAGSMSQSVGQAASNIDNAGKEAEETTAQLNGSSKKTTKNSTPSGGESGGESVGKSGGDSNNGKKTPDVEPPVERMVDLRALSRKWIGKQFRMQLPEIPEDANLTPEDLEINPSNVVIIPKNGKMPLITTTAKTTSSTSTKKNSTESTQPKSAEEKKPKLPYDIDHEKYKGNRKWFDVFKSTYPKYEDSHFPKYLAGKATSPTDKIQKDVFADITNGSMSPALIKEVQKEIISLISDQISRIEEGTTKLPKDQSDALLKNAQALYMALDPKADFGRLLSQTGLREKVESGAEEYYRSRGYDFITGKYDSKKSQTENKKTTSKTTPKKVTTPKSPPPPPAPPVTAKPTSEKETSFNAFKEFGKDLANKIYEDNIRQAKKTTKAGAALSLMKYYANTGDQDLYNDIINHKFSSIDSDIETALFEYMNSSIGRGVNSKGKINPGILNNVKNLQKLYQGLFQDASIDNLSKLVTGGFDVDQVKRLGLDFLTPKKRVNKVTTKENEDKSMPREDSAHQQPASAFDQIDSKEFEQLILQQLLRAFGVDPTAKPKASSEPNPEGFASMEYKTLSERKIEAREKGVPEKEYSSPKFVRDAIVSMIKEGALPFTKGIGALDAHQYATLWTEGKKGPDGKKGKNEKELIDLGYLYDKLDMGKIIGFIDNLISMFGEFSKLTGRAEPNELKKMLKESGLKQKKVNELYDLVELRAQELALTNDKKHAPLRKVAQEVFGYTGETQKPKEEKKKAKRKTKKQIADENTIAKVVEAYEADMLNPSTKYMDLANYIFGKPEEQLKGEHKKVYSQLKNQLDQNNQNRMNYAKDTVSRIARTISLPSRNGILDTLDVNQLTTVVSLLKEYEAITGKKIDPNDFIGLDEIADDAAVAEEMLEKVVRTLERIRSGEKPASANEIKKSAPLTEAEKNQAWIDAQNKAKSLFMTNAAGNALVPRHVGEEDINAIVDIYKEYQKKVGKGARSIREIGNARGVPVSEDTIRRIVEREHKAGYTVDEFNNLRGALYGIRNVMEPGKEDMYGKLPAEQKALYNVLDMYSRYKEKGGYESLDYLIKQIFEEKYKDNKDMPKYDIKLIKDMIMKSKPYDAHATIQGKGGYYWTPDMAGTEQEAPTGSGAPPVPPIPPGGKPPNEVPVKYDGEPMVVPITFDYAKAIEELRTQLIAICTGLPIGFSASGATTGNGEAPVISMDGVNPVIDEINDVLNSIMSIFKAGDISNDEYKILKAHADSIGYVNKNRTIKSGNPATAGGLEFYWYSNSKTGKISNPLHYDQQDEFRYASGELPDGYDTDWHNHPSGENKVVYDEKGNIKYYHFGSSHMLSTGDLSLDNAKNGTLNDRRRGLVSANGRVTMVDFRSLSQKEIEALSKEYGRQEKALNLRTYGVDKDGKKIRTSFSNMVWHHKNKKTGKFEPLWESSYNRENNIFQEKDYELGPDGKPMKYYNRTFESDELLEAFKRAFAKALPDKNIDDYLKVGTVEDYKREMPDFAGGLSMAEKAQTLLDTIKSKLGEVLTESEKIANTGGGSNPFSQFCEVILGAINNIDVVSGGLKDIAEAFREMSAAVGKESPFAALISDLKTLSGLNVDGALGNISTTLSEFSTNYNRMNGIITDSDIKSSYESIKGLTGQEKELGINRLMSQYQKYTSTGGKLKFADLEKDSNVVKLLNDEYTKFVANQEKLNQEIKEVPSTKAIFDDTSLQKFNESIEKITSSLSQLVTELSSFADMYSRVTGVVPGKVLEQDFANIQKSFNAILNDPRQGNVGNVHTGRNSFKKDLMEQYYNYVSRGGTRSIEELTDDRLLKSKLSTAYVSYLSSNKKVEVKDANLPSMYDEASIKTKIVNVFQTLQQSLDGLVGTAEKLVTALALVEPFNPNIEARAEYSAQNDTGRGKSKGKGKKGKKGKKSPDIGVFSDIGADTKAYKKALKYAKDYWWILDEVDRVEQRVRRNESDNSLDISYGITGTNGNKIIMGQSGRLLQSFVKDNDYSSILTPYLKALSKSLTGQRRSISEQSVIAEMNDLLAAKGPNQDLLSMIAEKYKFTGFNNQAFRDTASKLNEGSIKSIVNGLEADVRKLEQPLIKNPNQAYFDQLQKIRDIIKEIQGKHLDLFDPEDAQELKNMLIDVESIKAELKQNKSLYKKADTDKVNQLQRQIEEFKQTNSRALLNKDVVSQFELLGQSINNVKSEADLTTVKAQFEGLRHEIVSTGQTGLTFFDNWKKRMRGLAGYLSTFFNFYQIIRAVRTGIENVKQLDAAFIEMQKVSNDSQQALKNFADMSFEAGSSVGVTGLQMQQSAADWMRLGESITQAQESARISNELLQISEFEDINSATQSLVAVSQAYRDLDKIEIVDKLNNIGNNFSISTNELAEGLQRASATLLTQGNTLDEAIALITAGNNTIQDSARVAAGIKTISLRIAGTEEAKDELVAEGEDAEDYVVMTKSKKRDIIKDYTAVASNDHQGVDILDENGNYKSTFEILREISEVYKEIQEEDKKFGTNRASALIEELAGKNRSNIAAAILQNGELLEKVREYSLDSEGSAQKELDRQLESLDTKIVQIKNDLQELSKMVIPTDMFKGMLEGADALLDVLNKLLDSNGVGFGSLLGLITGTGIALGGHGINGRNGSLPKVLMTMFQPSIFQGNSEYSMFRNAVLPSDIVDPQKIRALQGNDQLQRYMGSLIVGQTKTYRDLLSANMSNQGVFDFMGAINRNGADLDSKIDVDFVRSLNIEGMNQYLDDLIEKAKETGEELGNINYQSFFEGFEQSTYAADQRISAFSKTISKLGKTVKGVLSNIGTALLTSAIFFIITKIGQLIDENLIHKFENLQDKSSKAFAEYSNTKSEIDDINTKLEENGKLIDKLEAQGTLTITEEVELQKLQAENEELERQLALKKELAEEERREATELTIEEVTDSYIKDPTRQNYITDEYGQMVAVPSYGTPMEVAKNEIAKIKALKKEQKEFADIINDEKATKEQKEDAEKQYLFYASLIDDYEAKLGKLIPSLENARDQLADDDVAKETFEELTDIVDEYINRNKSDLEVAKSNFDKFISSEGEGIEELKEKIALGAESGKSLSTVLSELGISIGDISAEPLMVLKEYFDDVKSGATGLDDVVKVLSLDIDKIAEDESSALSRINKAFEGGEKGDTYASMLEKIKTAKELAESGDTGTEKFKAIAAFFSPTGAEDLDDWKENLPKITKYFTEDSTGVKKFMDDLVEALPDANIKDGVYNIPDYFDAEKVGKKLGIGAEAVVALMGEAMDKGLSKDFFTTPEEGFETLIGLENELAEAELEYNKLQETGASKVRLDAQKQEIEDLKTRIEQCTTSLDKMFNKFEKDGKKKGKAPITPEDKKDLDAYVKKYNDLNNKDWDKNGTTTEGKQWKSSRGELGNAVIQTLGEYGLDYGYNNRGQIMETDKIDASNKRLENFASAIEILQDETKEGTKGYEKASQNIEKWAKEKGLSADEFIKRYSRENLLTEEQLNELRQTAVENNTDSVKENTDAINSLSDAIKLLAKALGVDLNDDGKDKSEEKDGTQYGKNNNDDGTNPSGRGKSNPIEDTPVTPGVETLTGKNEFGGRKTYTTTKKSTTTRRIEEYNGKPTPTTRKEWRESTTTYKIVLPELTTRKEFRNGPTLTTPSNVPGTYIWGKPRSSNSNFWTGNGAGVVHAGEVPKGYVYRTYNKNVGLANRPRVDYKTMWAKGWDTEEGSYSTVDTIGYTDKNGKEYVVTPILPDGKVLNKKDLNDYMDKVMNGGEDYDNLVISTFDGENARKAADDYAEALHEVHAAYYSNDKATQKALHSLEDYTAEELRSVDLTDDSTSEMENSFVGLMESLNLTSDQAEQLINVLQDMGLLKVQPQVDLSGVTSVDQLNDKLSGELNVGQSVTYTANVDDAEQEVKALEEVEGKIKYTVIDKDGTEKEVEPLKNQDGTITYHVVSEEDKGKKKKKKKKKGENEKITTETEVDTKGFEKGKVDVEHGVNALSKENATPKVTLQGAMNASSQLNNLRSEMNRLDGKKSTMTIETIRRQVIEKKYKQSHKSEGGNTKEKQFNGTFHLSNAHANGTVSKDVSIPKNETALINELGEEIIVRDGKAMTFNNGYPTFAKLRKGDIVFNHKQTEELEENGYVTGSHAKIYGGESAFATGTVISNAYATWKPPTTTSKKKDSSKKNTGKKNTGKKNTGKKNTGKKKGKSSWEKFEEWLGQLFDWVEVRLDRLSEKTERWGNLFEKFVDAAGGNAQSAYNAAIKSAKNEQKYTTTASNKYLSEALDVGLKGAKAAGTKKGKNGKKVRNVSDKWVKDIYKKILNDNLDERDIVKYGEKKKGIIDAMQGYIDKAKEAAKSTVELTESINDLIKSQRDAKVEFKKSALSSFVESDNRYGASSKNSALARSNAVSRYAINEFDSAVTSGNSYFGTLGSQAKSAGKLSYKTKKVKVKNGKKTKTVKKKVANNATTKIYESLTGKNKKTYKSYLTQATNCMNGKKIIPQKIIDFFEKFNPSLAGKYEAWNMQVANMEALRQEAADNYAENIKSIMSNISESYANIDEDTENAISLIESRAENMGNADQANAELNKLRSQRANIIANDKAEINTYQSLMTSYAKGMNGGYKGTRFSKASSDIQKKVTAAVEKARGYAKNNRNKIPDDLMMTLYGYYVKGYLSAGFLESCLGYNLAFDSAKQAEAQLEIDEETRKQEALDLYDRKASNINSHYDTRVSAIEARKRSIGGNYDDTITQAEIIKERTEELDKLRQNLNDAVKNGDVIEGTDQWLERVVEIQEKSNELNDLKLEKFETEIEEKFERAIQKANELIDKFDEIKNLINEEMLYDKKSGQLTELGWLSVGLNSKALAEEKKNLQYYLDERNRILKEYEENGTTYFGDKTFDEKIEEVNSNILSTFSNIKSVNDDLLNILEGQADAELEALQKVIDKRKEALSRKKEYYDYDKTIKGKTKDLQSLEQQIRALEGVAGQEAAAKRANLMAQRKEMQEDLDETVKEHIYNLQIEGLDDMMDDLHEQLDDWKKDIHSDLEAQVKAIEGLTEAYKAEKIPFNLTVSTLLNGTANGEVTSETFVNDMLNNDGSKTIMKSGDKMDTATGDTSVLEETGVVPVVPEGTPAKNPVASGALPTTTTKKPSTTTKKPSTTTKKQTVKQANAKKAFEYIFNGKTLKWASKENTSWGKLNKTLWASGRQVYMPKANQIAAWKKLGFDEKNFTTDKLLHALKETGIWLEMKKVQAGKDKHISLKGAELKNIHGYAKGGIVHRSGRYLTDEKGEEIIITKQGILRPLSAGTSVIPADITEKLYAIASNYDMGANARISPVDMSKLQRVGGETISPIINCPITIEGNANEQDVINAINKTLPKISKHVQNDIRKDLRKSGR